MHDTIPLIVILFINLIFIVNNKKISLFIHLYDIPDKQRKFHTKKTPILGGLLIFINLIIISIFYFTSLQNIIFLEDYYNNFRSFIIFVVGATSFFFIGIYDDKYNISSSKRLLIFICLLLFIVSIDSSIVIKIIKFSFTDQVIYLEEFSKIFTILCFLLFINAFNMYDGINLQSSLYSIIILVYLLISNGFDYFTLLFLISIISYLYLNFFGKSFLGDGGTYIIGFIISYIIIKSYNIDQILKSDEIFLLMMLPGTELLRLAIFRIANGRNPFSPDREHLHHYLIDNIGLYKANCVLSAIVLFPLLTLKYINNLLLILIFISMYLFLIFIYRHKK